MGSNVPAFVVVGTTSGGEAAKDPVRTPGKKRAQHKNTKIEGDRLLRTHRNLDKRTRKLLLHRVTLVDWRVLPIPRNIRVTLSLALVVWQGHLKTVDPLRPTVMGTPFLLIRDGKKYSGRTTVIFHLLTRRRGRGRTRILLVRMCAKLSTTQVMFFPRLLNGTQIDN